MSITITASEFCNQMESNSIATAERDVACVAQWMKCAVTDLSLQLEDVAIEHFSDLIQELLASYSLFPKEEKRTLKIVKLLKTGEQPLPVFIEAGDQHQFIMEGRHRIVAFHLAGLSSITVAYVSRNSN